VQVTHAQRSEAAHRDAENAQQLLAGNAAALEGLKGQVTSTSEQMAELLEVVKAMKLAPAAAAAAAAGSGAVERWHINAKDIVYEYEVDEDDERVRTELGAGSFGVVYVVFFFVASATQVGFGFSRSHKFLLISAGSEGSTRASGWLSKR
jgi:hypothetical protein